jgi:hypothetical protein
MGGHKTLLLNESDISRVIEMAWEDRTPFEAIELQFGLNQDAKHTWFPFWLFCIMWAFVSYGLSSFVCYLTGSTSDTSSSTDETSNVVELNSKAKKNSKNTMKSGYYVLDKEAYDNNGIPKYIFLGSDAPNQNE